LPKPGQAEIDLVKNLTGESKTFIEFLQGFASKGLAVTAVLFFTLTTLAIATMESDARFAERLLMSAAAVCGVYVWGEARKAVAKCDVYAKRALNTELTTTLEKLGQ
jgi:hypothetical protein